MLLAFVIGGQFNITLKALMANLTITKCGLVNRVYGQLLTGLFLTWTLAHQWRGTTTKIFSSCRRPFQPKVESMVECSSRRVVSWWVWRNQLEGLPWKRNIICLFPLLKDLYIRFLYITIRLIIWFLDFRIRRCCWKLPLAKYFCP